MHEYATHQQTLVAAVMRSSGPVLELGAGDYSTWILHEICVAQQRELLTLEYNVDWLRRFQRLSSPYHILRHVTDWASETAIDRNKWAVVFVDHSPGERRRIELARLHARPIDYIVVHDTDPNPAAGYGLEPVFDRFKYRRDFWDIIPGTTVVSNVREIWRD